MLTLTRWLKVIMISFFLYVTALTILNSPLLTKSIKDVISIFNQYGEYTKYLLMLLSGFLLNKLLMNLYIHGKNRSFSSFYKYPPLSISFLLFPFAFYILNMLGTTFKLTSFHLYMVMNNYEAFIRYFFIGLLLEPLYFMFRKFYCMFRKFYLNIMKNDNLTTKVEVEEKSKITYEDFQDWFKDDFPIKDVSNLTSEYRLYYLRILKLINHSHENNKGVHVALCGDFGIGKSSIIKCVEKNLSDEFICSNIDVWGVNYNSIGPFLLNKVISDVSSCVDVSELRKLPAQYIEALKLGNKASAFIAIFTGSFIEPEKGLKKLDSILGAIGKKLLITVQDVDRCNDPKKTTEELAALLDKLKNLNNISFILALGYKENISEVIRKVCSYRDDVLAISFESDINNFKKALFKKAQKNNIKNESFVYRECMKREHYGLIKNSRSLKSICKRVDDIWKPKKLLGEISLDLLFFLITIKHEASYFFDFLVKSKQLMTNEYGLRYPIDKEVIIQSILSIAPQYIDRKIIETLLDELLAVDCNYYYPQNLSTESLHANYFNRAILEEVPSNEVSDQKIIGLLKSAHEKKSSIDELLKGLQSDALFKHWIYSYIYFNDVLKQDSTNVTVYQKMADFYYEADKDKNSHGEMFIFDPSKKNLMTDLFKKIITENNVVDIFKSTLKIPLLLEHEIIRALGICILERNNGELFTLFLSELKMESELTRYFRRNHNRACEFVSLFMEKQFKGKGEVLKETILSLLITDSRSENAIDGNQVLVITLIAIYASDFMMLSTEEKESIYAALIDIESKYSDVDFCNKYNTSDTCLKRYLEMRNGSRK